MRTMFVLGWVVAAACQCEEEPTDLGGSDSGLTDTGARDLGPDSGTGDAGAVDSGSPRDSGAGDTGVLPDAGRADLGVISGGGSDDAGPADLGVRGTCSGPAECGGEPCLVVPDSATGWHTCAVDNVPEAVACQGKFDTCCQSEDCADGPGGKCLSGIPFYCSGPPPPMANLCTYDECGPQQPCAANQLCLPARAFGEPARRCVEAECRDDQGCTSRAGGRCLPFFQPCRGRLDGFYCVYPDSPCDEDGDCTALVGGYCAPGVDGQTECREFIPPP